MPASSSQKLRHTSAVALTLMLASLFGGTVWAQQAPQPPQAVQAAGFSPHDLKSFAKAAVDVHRVARKAEASWKAAKTKQDKQAVAQSARRREIQAVKAHGMTVRKYKAIAMAARSDPRTRAKIMAYIKQYSNQGTE